MSKAKVDEWLHADKGSPWKRDSGGGITASSTLQNMRDETRRMQVDNDAYEMQGAMDRANDEIFNRRMRSPLPRDDGGGITSDSPTIGGPTPSPQTQNPMMQGMIQRYTSLPTEKLTELAARLGGTPQGQIIERLLTQRRMMPSTAPAAPQAQPQQVQPQAVQLPQVGQGYARGGAPKRSHKAVHYEQTGMPSAHCGICEHFRAPHSCEIVESPISRDGWCNQFRKRQALRDGGTVKRDVGGMMGLSTAEPWWTRAEARGDSGLLHGATGGQADQVKTQAPPGSFVVPAEVVAGLGQGNTLAGARVMQSILDTGPRGTPLSRGTRGRGPPRPPSVPAELRGGLKEGGEVPLFEAKARGGGKTEPGKTPVDLSHGEFVISPEHVKAWGGGDTERGIRIWNKWTWAKHKEHVKDLKEYKGPVGMKKEDKT